MKIVVATAVVVAVVFPVIWQEYAIARTRLENRNLAAALDDPRGTPEAGAVSAEADWGTHQTQKQLDDRADLNRLRQQVPVLRAQLDEARARAASLTAAARDAQQTGAPVIPPPGFTFLSAARDVGAASATSMFQTLSSALAKGDTNRIMQLCIWASPAAQEKIAHELADIAAEAATPGFADDAAFRVVREVPLPNGDTAVVIEMWQNGQPQRRVFRARQVGAEWHQVLGDDGQPETVDLGADINGN